MTPETMLPHVVLGVGGGFPFGGRPSGTREEGPCMGVQLWDPNDAPTEI